MTETCETIGAERVRPRIGLLPLHLALYDESVPELRAGQQGFVAGVVRTLGQLGCEVVEAPICCLKPQVNDAVRLFEEQSVHAIVTVHIAYSPSLESAGPLAQTAIPIILLDTTPDLAFDGATDPEKLLYNHGIHGVQDLCAVLRRLGRNYEVVAGHLSDGCTIRKLRGVIQGAVAASTLRRMKALRIGPTFVGMGDFQVDEAVLGPSLGICTDQISPADLVADAAAVSDEDIAAEMAADREQFDADVDETVHRRTTRLCLGLRRYLARGGYGAFSMSFTAFDTPDDPVATVPFLECCKAMARGIGYAGEGDVLTASLVGALQRGFGATTFTEIFCPDWRGDSLFISHMGEFNPQLAAERPRLYEKPFKYTPANNPACLAMAPRPGPATLVNLAPGPGNTFRLITAPVEILPDGSHPGYQTRMRGWLRQSMPLPDFLEEYSRLGGTHHSALMLGQPTRALAAFASMCGIEYREVAGERRG